MTYRNQDDGGAVARRRALGEDGLPTPDQIVVPPSTDWSEVGYEAANPTIESRSWLDAADER